MKTINQERILETYGKVHRHYFGSDRGSALLDSSMAIAGYGLKAVLGCEDDPDKVSRVKLECHRLGYNPFDPETPKKMVEELWELGDKCNARQRKLTEIQVRYGVSGLYLERIQWGKDELCYFSHDDRLALTDSDKEQRRQQKQEILEFWLKTTSANNLAVWHLDDSDERPYYGWTESSCDRVLALAPLASWVRPDLATNLDDPHFYLDLKLGDDDNIGGFVSVPQGVYPIT